MEELRAAGTQVVGVSIDSVEKNAALTEAHGFPFALLADPDGEGAIKSYDAWHPDEERARPATVLVAPDGSEVWRYDGATPQERPLAATLLEKARKLELPEIIADGGMHGHLPAARSESAYAPERLRPFLGGVKGASGYLESATGDDRASALRAFAEEAVASLDSRA